MLEYIHMDIKYVMVILNRISTVIKQRVLISLTFFEAQKLTHAYLEVP